MHRMRVWLTTTEHTVHANSVPVGPNTAEACTPTGPNELPSALHTARKCISQQSASSGARTDRDGVAASGRDAAHRVRDGSHGGRSVANSRAKQRGALVADHDAEAKVRPDTGDRMARNLRLPRSDHAANSAIPRALLEEEQVSSLASTRALGVPEEA